MPATPTAAETEKKTITPPKPARSRWKRKLFVFVLLLVGLVAAAPMIVARTSLRNEIVPYVLPQFSGHVTFGESSLGWFSPVEIRSVRIADEDGKEVATAERVDSSLSLLDMVLQPSRLGTITITGLKLNAEFAPGESNVETLIASLASTESSSNGMPEVEVVLKNAEVVLTERSSGQASIISTDESTWQFAGSKHQIAGTLTADIAPGATPGTLKIAGTLDDTETGAWSGEVTSDNFPLTSLQPLLTRANRTETVSGFWTGQWTASGELSKAESLSIAGSSGLKDLQIREAARPILALDAGQFELDTTASETGWTVRRLSAKTDFGVLALDGETQLPSLQNAGNIDAALRSLLARPMKLTGRADLAQLAARFPGLVTIRENVQIAEGTCDLNVVSEPTPDGAQLRATARMSKLVATTPERQLVWDAPFVAGLNLSEHAGQWKLEELRVNSRAIDVRGSGSWSQAEITANCNLQEFAREWGQIIDFGDVVPSGTLQGRIISRLVESDRVQLNGEFNGQNLSFGLPADAPRSFALLKLEGQAIGTLDAAQNVRWESLAGRISTDKETLTARMVEGDGSAADHSARDWNLSATGTLENLDREIGLTVRGETLAGRFRASALLSTTADEFVLSNINTEIDQFVWAQNGRRLNEEKVVLQGTATISRNDKTFRSKELTINSRTAAVRLTDVEYAMLPTGPRLVGEMAARGRIERVLAALDPSGTALPRAEGMFNLQLSADSTFDKSTLKWNAFSEGLRWIETTQVQGIQPISQTQITQAASELQLQGTATIDRGQDRVDLSGVNVDLGFLTLVADGSVTRMQSEPLAQLRGTCRYDWETLSQRFPTLASSGVQLAGRHETPFTATFPLSGSAGANQMTGGFDLKWDAAKFENLDFGPASFAVVLKPGKVQVEPVTLQVASGAVSFSPSILFREQGKILQQSPVKLIDKVQLNEELSQHWLQYISPMTADATRVEGTFSVDITDALNVPLERWQAMTGKGIVDIAHAEMRPGPAAMQFINLGKQLEALRKGMPIAAPEAANDPKALLVIDQQQVPFAIQNGRVYHRDLRMLVRGLNVRTEGSVGFDDTVDLVAEIDIPADWTSNGKPIRDTWGTSIKVPIRGTLQRPMMDGRIIQSLLDQLVRGKINNLLEGELNKQFEKLFRPR